MRYARQRLIPGFENLDEILKTKRVAVIGSGGIGGLCLYMLTGAGLLHLTVADDDTIEDSNLHRQVLFCQEDLGKSKSECCKRELEKLDGRVEVRCFGRVTSENFEDFSKNADLVMDLSDNVATRQLASAMCFKFKKDLIHCSVAASSGMLCAFRFSDPEYTKRFGCYACFAGADAKPAFRGITGPWAGTMACAAASLAMDHFAGKDIFGKLWLYDLETRNIRTLNLKRDVHCTVCGDHK
ncbi:MAG: HesA/MoeB/ThiF family protein [Succinatimonas sp.]|nr:HesA/MoeB/ThiF family protein [Succinatimonas sp.]